jgi:hypothetical protein
LSEPAWPDTTTNKRWFRMEFVLTQPAALSYANFVSATLQVPRTFLDTTASRWIGLVFDYSAAYDSGSGVFQFQIPEDSVKDYDYHLASLPATGGKWMRDTLYWSDFRQGGWGKDAGPLEARQIVELQLRAAGAGRGSLQIDNLALLGTEGASLPLAVRNGSPRPSWAVRRQGDLLLVETPSGTKNARVRLLDAAGREQFRSSGTGMVGVPCLRAGVYLLDLEADGAREIRKLTMVN